MDSLINSVLSPFLPAPIVSFLRSHLTGMDSTLSNYAPKFIVDQIPLLMSLVALYFGFLSVMRAARVAWRSFLFFAKYGGLALVGTVLYSLYQGDTTAIRSSLSTATSVASSISSLGGLSSLGSLAAWWLGLGNTETLKTIGSYAAKYFSPESDTATASTKKTQKRKNSDSNLWDSFLPPSGAGSPSSNTRSKKKENIDPKGLFEEVFGETPKRAGGGGGGDSASIVSGFLEKVVGAAGGDSAVKLRKMAEAGWKAYNGEEKDGQGRTEGR